MHASVCRRSATHLTWAWKPCDVARLVLVWKHVSVIKSNVILVRTAGLWSSKRRRMPVVISGRSFSRSDRPSEVSRQQTAGLIWRETASETKGAVVVWRGRVTEEEPN